LPSKILIAIPAGMLSQVDFIASCEHRTRSDLVREALRRYVDTFRDKQVPLSVSTMNASEPEEE
jgi:metal-responsive CopG/Arc/MetJ family transcriptional regulator